MDDTRGGREQDRGFILVLLLLMISLLSVLVVTFSTAVLLESRRQNSAKSLHEARHNALLALEEAVATLQSSAGPDQRVTATADILSQPGHSLAGGARYWTGVWDNRILNNDGTADNPYSYGANRDPSGKLKNPPTWLISAPLDSSPDPANAVTSLGGAANTVIMVGETISGQADSVLAGKIAIEQKRKGVNRPIGHFAWWVGDEGVKAHLSQRDRLDALTPSGSRQQSGYNALRLNIFQKADGRRFDTGSHTAFVANSKWLDRLSAPQDFLALARLEPGWQGIDQSWFKQHRHDFTTYSLGLQTDTARGGLKLDLSRGLEEQWPAFTTYLRDNQDLQPKETGYADVLMQPLFKVPAPAGGNPAASPYIYGPYWDLLYSFYQEYKPYQPWIADVRTSPSSATSYRPAFYGYISGNPPADSKNAFRDASDPKASVSVAGGFESARFDSSGWSHVQRRGIAEIRPPNRSPCSELSPGIWQRADFFGLTPVFRNTGTVVNGEFLRGDPYYHSVAPVLVKFQATIAVASEAYNESGKIRYRLRLYIMPQFVFWNPYNTAIPASNYYMDATFSVPIQLYASSPDTPDTPALPLLDSVTGASGTAYDSVNSADGGVDLARLFFLNSKTYSREGWGFRLATSATGFGPGEGRIFTLPGLPQKFSNQYTDARDAVGTSNESTYFLKEGYNPSGGFWVPLERTARFSLADAGYPSPPSSDGWAVSSNNPANYNDVPGVKATDEITLKIFARPVTEKPQAQLGAGTFIVGPLYTATLGGGVVTQPGQGLLADDIVIPLGQAQGLTARQNVLTLTCQLKPFGSSDTPVLSLYNIRQLNAVDHLSPVKRTTSDIYSMSTASGAGASIVDIQHSGGSPSLPFLGSAYDVSGQNRLALFENPILPLSSVGDFMHANISLLEPYPAYAVGSSLSSPYIPLDQYAGHVNNVVTGAQVTVPDLSYLLNTSLFDGFFFSTTPPDLSALPSIYDSNLENALRDAPPFEPVDADYVDAEKPLPNSRMQYLRQPGESTVAFLDGLRDFRTAASKVAVRGAFNINSTSVDAWRAVLAGLSADETTSLTFPKAGGGVTTINSSDGVIFSRFSQPIGSVADKWLGARKLTDAELDSLAQAIVDQVRNRGPFLSLGDFVNRRLVNSEEGRMGALQAAIENTGLNTDSAFGPQSTATPTGGHHGANLAAGFGVPGTLLQNDILRALAPMMSARSDTFLVRVYGDSANPATGQIESRVWGEAVVQRTAEFVDTSDVPEKPVYTKNGALNLSEKNRAMGRRFKVLGFRWLTEAEL